VAVTNNNQTTPVSNLTLVVALPTNLDFSALSGSPPAGCVYNGGVSPATLTCSLANLGALGVWNVVYDGLGLAAGTSNTTATVSAAGNVDANSGNDSLPKVVTSIKGADLAITHAGPAACTTCTAASGANFSFTINVANNGPDPTASFRVTDNLPATADFTSVTATGTSWSCTIVSTTATCYYTGSALTTGNSAPPITVSGRIVTSAGTITNGASVASTDPLTGDPDLTTASNGVKQVLVNVTPGTDLRANKTMVSTSTGSTNYAMNENLTLTLSATNQGPQNATGVTITDTVPAGFTAITRSNAAANSACTVTGQDISCTVGALASGATSSSYVFTLKAPNFAVALGSNIANIARVLPVAGANTPATVNYTVATSFAHLILTKTKTPNPVAAGGTITNTIRVRNDPSSTSAVSGTVTVTDQLDAHETYQSAANGWVCSGVAAGSTGTLTCTYTLGAAVAPGSYLPDLIIYTTAAAGYSGSIGNQACTGSAISTTQTPTDNVANTCVSATITGSNKYVDIGIAKTVNGVVSTATPGLSIPGTMSSFYYDLVVTAALTANGNPADTAPTVNVSDVIPNWYNSGGLVTGGGVSIIAGAGPGDTCAFASTVTCTLYNMVPGTSRTIRIIMNRPVVAGNYTNTGRVATPDAIDTNSANNQSNATISVDPVADVAVTAMSGAPNPDLVGQVLTFTTSVKNNGPNGAVGVVVRQPLDSTRMSYVSGSAAISGTGSSTCAYTASFVGAPYAGQAGVQCSLNAGTNMAVGESRQMTFQAIPVYPYPDTLNQACSDASGNLCAPYAMGATITTTSVESDAPGYANNSRTGSVDIKRPNLDLSVLDNDHYTDGGGTVHNYDPLAFGGTIVYTIDVHNAGPSRATGVKLLVTPTPPAGGTPAAYTMTFNSAGSTLPAGATCSNGAGADLGKVVCFLAATQGASLLAPNGDATFNLAFDTGPISNNVSSTITYATTAVVSSYETLAGYDNINVLNNSATETTTVLPSTDLLVISKTRSAYPVDINQSFSYDITVGNIGPSPAASVTVTDVLPAGLVRTGTAISFNFNSSGATGTCAGVGNSDPAAGSGGTVICTLSNLPVGGDLDSTKQVVITIPVRAAYQTSGTYAFGTASAGFNTDFPNTACIAPAGGTSIDPSSGNDCQTVQQQVRKNSIAGYVYVDSNLSDSMSADGSEGLNGVGLALTGTDAYKFTYGSGGNYPALSATTAGAGASTGAFLFDALPPGTWTVVETQPGAYQDKFETLGTAATPGFAAGVKPADICDGSTNCSASAAANTMSGITLPADFATAATGYLFQEVSGGATISGYVFIDSNVNAGRDPGETTGLASLDITLTDGSGATVATTKTNNIGYYIFSGLPPGTYTVTETPPASGYTHTGAQAGSSGGSIGGSAQAPNAPVPGATNTAISAIVLATGDISAGNNFGEIAESSIEGRVYYDASGDHNPATAPNVGIKGVTVNLWCTSGDCLAGNPAPHLVGTTVTADGTGALPLGGYKFTGLMAGTFTVEEVQPAAWADGTTTAGTGGAGFAGTAGVKALPSDPITGIVIASLETLVNYNFGELAGTTLSGAVFVDDGAGGGTLNDGRQNGTELGLANQTVTLTGSAGGTCVNTAVPPAFDAIAATCTTKTLSDGSYSFVIATPGTFNVVETQPAGYLDGTTNPGTGTTAPGSTAPKANPVVLPAGGPYVALDSDPINSVQVAVGQHGVNFDFGEQPLATSGQLSGDVYVDNDRSGGFTAGDTGLAGVDVTLWKDAVGTGGTQIATCNTTGTNACSGVDGHFSFTGLAAGTYFLVETQPSTYLDGEDTLGSKGGILPSNKPVAGNASDIIASIPIVGGDNAINYRFLELQPASISGHVWLNTTPGQTVYGSNVIPMVNWLVQVLDGTSQVVASQTTDAQGYYNIPVPAGVTYTVQFRQTALTPVWAGVVVNATPVQCPTCAPNADRTAIVNVTPGANSLIPGLDLPIDPSGIVYDSRTGLPIPGAEVTIHGPAGFTANNVATGSLSQLTGSDGSYQFLLVNSPPAGTYTLTVTSRPNYQDAPSGVVAVCNNSLTISPLTNAKVQDNAIPPALSVLQDPTQHQNPATCPGASSLLAAGGATNTLYYLSFVVGPTSGNVINNNIPLDPIGGTIIIMTKTTPLLNVVRGDLVPYTLTAKSVANFALTGMTVEDLMPPGFKYKTGSATMDGVSMEPVVNSRNLSWSPVSFGPNNAAGNAPAAMHTFKMLLVVGSGVGEGIYNNCTWTMQGATTMSNRPCAPVRVVPDPTFDCPDVIGKVFDDKNANGYQDQGEPGIPNVRMATPRGLLVTSDAEGRFHVPCPEIPNPDRGSNFFMKLDDRTLP
jgi:uncharacterized repeat protein (TIGR01451 family)